MRYWLALAISIGLVGLSSTGVYSQSRTPIGGSSNPNAQAADDVDPIFRLWARNIARHLAESENGGIQVYRAEPAMHGPPSEAPFVVGNDGALRCTFRGFHPWDITDTGAPTRYFVETEVRVTPDRRYELIYNGPIR